MIWILACATPDGKKPADEAFVPLEGWWEVLADAEWGGDCALEDPSTDWGSPERWWYDLHDTGNLIVHTDLDLVLSCALDDKAFSCSVPWVGQANDADINATEVSEHRLEGEFSDEGAWTGEYVFTADCEGPGCGRLADVYGPEFEYPCTATAGVAGEYAD